MQAARQVGRQGGREEVGRQARRQAGRQAGRQASREAGRQAGRQAGKQAGRQADRQPRELILADSCIEINCFKGGPSAPLAALGNTYIGPKDYFGSHCAEINGFKAPRIARGESKT
jgi:hypothetical protein